LLLDTGGELNTAKSVRITREIAKNLVLALARQDHVSVIQFSDKVELLQDWTDDFKQVSHVLDTKLLSGKRARFSDGLSAAVNQFGVLPIGSRHIVLITDGVETSASKTNRAEALERVAASSAVVHTISYTTVSRETVKNSRRIVRNRDNTAATDAAVNTLPPDYHYDQLRHLHTPDGMTIDLDPKRQRRVRRYERDMVESESQLTSLSDESGGQIWLPKSFEEMFGDGAKAARLIDAEYVVTYKLKREMASATEGEVRRLEVVSRRVGLTVVSRRHYVSVGKHQSPP
jgi:hypothetical protein